MSSLLKGKCSEPERRTLNLSLYKLRNRPFNTNTAEGLLSERQSSETSNILTHIFFVLRSNNEKSAITSRNKVLCHLY